MEQRINEMIAKVQSMKTALPPLMRFFSAIALTIACSWAAATTFIDLTLDQMIAKTDFSFFGTVSKIHIEDRGEPLCGEHTSILRPSAECWERENLGVDSTGLFRR